MKYQNKFLIVEVSHDQLSTHFKMIYSWLKDIRNTIVEIDEGGDFKSLDKVICSIEKLSSKVGNVTVYYNENDKEYIDEQK